MGGSSISEAMGLGAQSAAAGMHTARQSWGDYRPTGDELAEGWGLLLAGVSEGIAAARFGCTVTAFRRHLVRGSTALAVRYAELQHRAAQLHAAAHTAMMQTVAEDAQAILDAHHGAQAMSAAGG